MADFKLFPQLKLTGGARFENTNLKITTQNPGSLPKNFFSTNFLATGQSKIQQLDLLPGTAATFTLMDNVNFRFAWSQTLARPSFKELGPVITKNFADDTYFLGNPELQLSKANNYDFRVEWFPRAGEVIASSLFYKKIIAPMEQTSFIDQATAQQYLQYTNAPANGTVYGIELEARKRLDQVSPILKNFSLYFNYSQIISSVPVSAETSKILAANNQPSDTRPLQGQPEYIINAGLNYDNDEYRFYAGLFYNVTGPFLYSVGAPSDTTGNATFFPDVYEQPAPSLDFNLTQGLTDNWKLTFRGKNLLNPFINRTQTYNGTEYIYSSYTKGWDVSMNASYSF
jgi:TonB-dependent receptor